MQIIRLENDKNQNENYYNKLLIFDSNSGQLKVYNNELFYLKKSYNLESILKEFNVTTFNYSDNYKLIINNKLKDTYSFPFKIYIDITDKCQLECKHCLTKFLNLGNELSFDTIKSIINECNEHGAFYVKLGGGEPLLHSEIFKIISEFRKIGMMVSISTNGLLMSKQIANFLKSQNVKVSISLEGPKKINDEIRGVGHYDKALNSLKILRDAGCNVFLRITLTRKILNTDYIKEMIDLANEYNVKLKISYCRPAGNAIDNELLIRYEDYQRYYEVLKLINEPKYSELIVMDEGMQFIQEPKLLDILYGNRICGSANRSMHINSQGIISPCVFLGKDFIEENSSYKYGDIYQYWSEQEGTKFREVRNINIPNECVSCARLCKYECLGTRYNVTNDFKESDPNCLKEVLKKCKKIK